VLKTTGWKDKEAINNRIDEVLDEAGLMDKKNSMPHELSGGEQQRVAIARAMLNSPKMIIADEPTGNLDAETACNILSLLKDISHTGTAVIMTTHNLPILEKFPGIVYQCHDGNLSDVTNDYNQNNITDGNEETSD
jgi:cell division transport system ATP-binding protein